MLQFEDVLNDIFYRKEVFSPLKTIIICDPGIDDALMLLQIMSNKKYEVVGIVPVEGNASYKTTLINTLNICEYISRFDIKIYPSSDYFAQKKIRTNIAPVYGSNGLGNVVLPTAKKVKPQLINGVEFACSALEKDKHIIVSTGPLVEVSKILQHLHKNNKNAFNNIVALSIMGGVVNCSQESNWPISGIRNTEANFAANITATQYVIGSCSKYKIPVFLSTLDLTHSILASKTDIALLKTKITPITRLASMLIASVPLHYQTRYERGPDGEYRQPLHDVHASNCLINPSLYYGKWINKDITLPATDCLAQQNNKNSNIFLLDMHYINRSIFFSNFITELKSAG